MPATRRTARVTDRLTTRDRQLAAWFKREGFVRPLLTVAALRKANIKPQTAAALLSKETGNGSNIFGCDHGPCGDAPPYCRQNVTERRAKRLRGSRLRNGVGPTQLTFEGYVDRARRAGGEWKPYVNMATGFGIFRELFEAEGDSIWAAAKRYNGRAEYANEFVARRKAYERKLRTAGFEV
jgi:hypothetical protein